MRILFGEKEAYLDKFKTSCRTRPIETQILGTAYYMKEHTKPLFHKHKILAFKNLYNYIITKYALKLLKFLNLKYHTTYFSFTRYLNSGVSKKQMSRLHL